MMAAGSKAQRRRTRRSRALAVLALLVALGSGLVMLAPRLVPSDRLTSRAAEALAAATGAEVTVGAAQLTMVGGPGLRLRQARIARAGQYDFELDHLDVSAAVWPLLRRQLVIDGVRARGPAGIFLWRGLPVDLSGFDCRVDRLRLDVPLTGGETAPPARVPADVVPLDPAGSFAFTAARMSWSALVLEKVEASGGIERRVLEVRSLTAGCGGGRLDGSATVDFAAVPGGAFAGKLVLDDVEARALLATWVPEVTSQLDARLTGDVQARGGLLDATTSLSTLEAEGRVTTGEGLLRAGPWLGEVEPYLGDRQDLVDIRITELRHVFRVADGRYLVDTLTIDGPDTEWSLGGEIGLDGRLGRDVQFGRDVQLGRDVLLDLGVHLRLPAGFTPRMGSLTLFAEALRDADRRVNLDFRLVGPIADPALTLDLSALARKSKGTAAGASVPGSPTAGGATGTPPNGLGALLDKWKGK